MKKSRTVRIVLCIVIGVLLARIAMSFCAVGLFYRFFYAR